MGWSTVEISTEHLVELERSENPDRAIESVLSTLRSLNLSAPQAHALIEADVSHPHLHKRAEDLRRLHRHIEIAAALGVQVVVIHPGGRLENATPAEQDRLLAANREAFRRLGDAAAQKGIRIALENLFRPWTATLEEMDALLNTIAHPAIGLALDTSHAHLAKLDIPEFIRHFRNHLIATHVSDNDGSGDQHRIPGYGKINWPPIMTALAEIGYPGPFNLEIPGERHPLVPLRKLKAVHALDVARWLLSLTH